MTNFSFQNKNVVILIKDAILGGAERQALGFAKYLKEQFNCSVSIVVTYSNNQSDEFRDFLYEIGIDKLHYFGEPSLSIKREFSINNIKKGIRALRYLIRITLGIRKLKPDVLVPFMNGPSKIAALIYKYTGAKTTFWHQLGLEVCFYDWLEKIAVSKSPIIIANATNGLEIFRDHYKVPEQKLFVLPQYVSLKKQELDKDLLKSALEIPKDTIVIGMIAHYREEKYQELLIEAFSDIAINCNVHLILLGNKDNNVNTLAKYNKLEGLIKQLNLGEKVSLLSGVDVHEVLNILDIGVLVSEIEGTPNVVMEYMLYGLPVIASNHKGCCVLLDDSSFLIPNDKNILVKKMEELLTNGDLRREEGTKNAVKIRQNSAENYFEKLQIILNNSR